MRTRASHSGTTATEQENDTALAPHSSGISVATMQWGSEVVCVVHGGGRKICLPRRTTAEDNRISRQRGVLLPVGLLVTAGCLVLLW